MKLIAFIVIFYPDNLHFPLGRHSNREMNVIALNVRGFYEYTWKNPINNRSEPKISYVTKVGDAWWGNRDLRGLRITGLEIPFLFSVKIWAHWPESHSCCAMPYIDPRALPIALLPLHFHCSKSCRRTS